MTKNRSFLQEDVKIGHLQPIKVMEQFSYAAFNDRKLSHFAQHQLNITLM